jgi:hypothetical protein
MTSSTREYKRYAHPNVTRVPNLKHASGDDPTRTLREPIRRPINAVPRNAADWR